MKIGNIIAGVGVMIVGYGLAMVSGLVAYDGLTAMTGLAIFGVVGPLFALGAASFGIAAELALKARSWSGLAVCVVLCLAMAGVDAYSGEKSLERRNADAAQILATARAAYDKAATTTADAGKVITDREAKLAVLTGPDVFAAQKLLGVKQDGKWGDITTAAMNTLAATYRGEIADARADIRANAAAVAKGAPVAEAGVLMPAWMAIVVSAAAVLCSFIGSIIAFGLKRETPEDELRRQNDETVASLIQTARGEVQARTAVLGQAALMLRQAGKQAVA